MKRPQGFDPGSQRSTVVGAKPVPTTDTEPIPLVTADRDDRAARPSAQQAAGEPTRTKRRVKGFRAASQAAQAETVEPAATSSDTSPGDRDRGEVLSPAVSGRGVRTARRRRKRFERNEVKRFTKRSRRRRILWLVSAGSVVAVVLLAVLTAFSPLMSLRTIDVVGTSRLEPAAIRAAVDDQLGKPLPLINFGAIKKELSGFTLIRSYSTQTQPPGTLVIRIVERAPIGLLKNADGFALVDAAGVTISSSEQRPGGYPVIEGSDPHGSASDQASFAASTAVLSALPPSVLPQVDSITAASADDVTLRLTDGKDVVWGGPDHASLKAADLEALLKSAPDASGYDVSSPSSPVTK